jgi:hypothetical protein
LSVIFNVLPPEIMLQVVSTKRYFRNGEGAYDSFEQFECTVASAFESKSTKSADKGYQYSFYPYPTPLQE